MIIQQTGLSQSLKVLAYPSFKAMKERLKTELRENRIQQTHALTAILPDGTITPSSLKGGWL